MARLKAGNFLFICSGYLLFQFHYGSIKGNFSGCRSWTKRRFNSTMVRLKALTSVKIAKGHDRFNSTMVRLKENLTSRFAGFSYCFNSTMVRLKDKTCAVRDIIYVVLIPLWFD